MKYVVILPDGAADEPLPQLDGRTPLQAARIPHMDWVARNGCLGRAVTIAGGFTPGTDVGTLTLFGYDPRKFYSGRAPLEALAKGLSVRDDQLIFRCNFVTVLEGKMKDFTAGHIRQDEADALIAALNQRLGPEGLDFHPGVSYRNLLLAAGAAEMNLQCAPPHDIPDQPVADHLPRGRGAERVALIMRRAGEVVAGHTVNQKRAAENRLPVTGIWLWGQGRPLAMPSFAERFGLRGAVITAVDILRGIAKGAGMDLIHVPGATGYIDTDYEAKGRAALRALETHDIVFVHIEAADEAGHLGDAAEKVKALERIDEAVVGPLQGALRAYPEWRILVAPDHPTPVSTKAHSAVPPLFAYAGSGVSGPSGEAFDEAAAGKTGLWIEPGQELMPRFLKN